MKNDLRQLHKKAKSIRLEKDAKDRIKNELFEYMKDNPVRNGSSERLMPIQNNLFKKLTMQPMQIAIIALIVSLAGGGATVAAAEISLPGDFLYPIKVNVNEEVVAALTLGDEASAEWEIERINRRLLEAEELEEAGELSEDTENTIEELINEHTLDLQSFVDDLKIDEDTEAVENIESQLNESLEEFEDVLEELEIDEKDLDLDADENKDENVDENKDSDTDEKADEEKADENEISDEDSNDNSDKNSFEDEDASDDSSKDVDEIDEKDALSEDVSSDADGDVSDSDSEDADNSDVEDAE